MEQVEKINQAIANLEVERVAAIINPRISCKALNGICNAIKSLEIDRDNLLAELRMGA